MLALCATIMCLAACDNEETNATGTNGTATVTATPAAKEEADNSSTKTENNAVTTVEPTTAPTVEATVTEAPAVPTEVSWEESGMSYELFENPDGTVAVIVTNHGNTTYACDDYTFTLEPNGKYYKLFYSTEDAEKFVNTITTAPVVTVEPWKYLTTEIPCTIAGDNSKDKYYEEYNYTTFEFKSDDCIEHFKRTTNLAIPSDYYEKSYYSFIFSTEFGIIILYDENNEIVAITSTAKPDGYSEFTGKIELPKGFEFSKMTMFMQYYWKDNSIE